MEKINKHHNDIRKATRNRRRVQEGVANDPQDPPRK